MVCWIWRILTSSDRLWNWLWESRENPLLRINRKSLSNSSARYLKRIRSAIEFSCPVFTPFSSWIVSFQWTVEMPLSSSPTKKSINSFAATPSMISGSIWITPSLKRLHCSYYLLFHCPYNRRCQEGCRQLLGNRSCQVCVCRGIGCRLKWITCVIYSSLLTNTPQHNRQI